MSEGWEGGERGTETKEEVERADIPPREDAGPVMLYTVASSRKRDEMYEETCRRPRVQVHVSNTNALIVSIGTLSLTQLSVGLNRDKFLSERLLSMYGHQLDPHRLELRVESRRSSSLLSGSSARHRCRSDSAYGAVHSRNKSDSGEPACTQD